jgi:DNA modification methylase
MVGAVSVRLLVGDVRRRILELPDESVHCVVTSPPYWGLRDYGVAGQLGLEPSYVEYVHTMVEVFRGVRRVLRKDGTLWLNMGDSYANYRSDNASGMPGQTIHNGENRGKPRGNKGNDGAEIGRALGCPRRSNKQAGLKEKDLCGIPWRVAFALQADGWYLRQDIIWSKPNPMPESITDRCTKAHEYLFLLSRSARYYYDAEAIKEPLSPKTLTVNTTPRKGTGIESTGEKLNKWMEENGGRYHPEKANKRSVWEVATQPFSEAHFALFPPALIEPCILAGCPKGGTVLDPFGGAGTTGLVADRLQRNAILIELNPLYAEMAKSRLINDAPLFVQVDKVNHEPAP